MNLPLTCPVPFTQGKRHSRLALFVWKSSAGPLCKRRNILASGGSPDVWRPCTTSRPARRKGAYTIWAFAAVGRSNLPGFEARSQCTREQLGRTLINLSCTEPATASVRCAAWPHRGGGTLALRATLGQYQWRSIRCRTGNLEALGPAWCCDSACVAVMCNIRSLFDTCVVSGSSFTDFRRPRRPGRVLCQSGFRQIYPHTPTHHGAIWS